MRWIYDREDYFLIIKELGSIMMIIAVLLLLPIIVAQIYGEDSAFRPFFISSFFALALGVIFRLFPKNTGFQRKHAVGMTVIAWPIVSIPSAIPFYLIGTSPTYLDGYFEAVSGWTTTGLTTIGGRADLFMHSVNFWRHLMQYVGGVGIIIMGMVVLAPMIDWKVTSEVSMAAGRKYRIVPSLNNTIKIIAGMYGILLLISTVLFFLAGMNPFDALNHAMAGLSTGGYSTKGRSLGAYTSPWIPLVALPIMIIGGTNFVLVYHLFRGKIEKYLQDIESKVFWLFSIVMLGSLILWFIFQQVSYSNVLDIVFMVVSALTTTGWSTVPAFAVLTQWAPLGLLILVGSMIVGANSSSTGGGIKAVRAGLIFKSIIWRTEKVIMPDSVVLSREYQHHVKKYVNDEKLLHIYSFVAIYMVVLILSFIIFCIFGHPIIPSFYEVTSAVGTVGLSSGLTSTSLHPLLKVLLCVDMWLGRIEILPLLYFIRYAWGKG